MKIKRDEKRKKKFLRVKEKSKLEKSWFVFVVFLLVQKKIYEKTKWWWQITI